MLKVVKLLCEGVESTGRRPGEVPALGEGCRQQPQPWVMLPAAAGRLCLAPLLEARCHQQKPGPVKVEAKKKSSRGHNRALLGACECCASPSPCPLRSPKVWVLLCRAGLCHCRGWEGPWPWALGCFQLRGHRLGSLATSPCCSWADRG